MGDKCFCDLGESLEIGSLILFYEFLDKKYNKNANKKRNSEKSPFIIRIYQRKRLVIR